MADQRGYNLPDSISTWDEDVYFNVDKSGFSRAKKYKASLVLEHMAGGGILSIQVDLDAGDVAALGVATELLPAAGTGKSYQLIDIKWKVTPSTQLDVGTQDLIIYFDTVSNYLAKIRNVNIEQSSEYICGVQIQAEHELKEDKRIYAKLSGGVNPSSGAGTMSFYFIYKLIDV